MESSPVIVNAINNVGVSYIENNQFRNAISTLRIAATTLLKDDSDDSSTLQHIIMMGHHHKKQQEQKQECSSTIYHQSEILDQFEKVIVVDPISFQHEKVPESNARLQVAVLHNLALSHLLLVIQQYKEQNCCHFRRNCHRRHSKSESNNHTLLHKNMTTKLVIALQIYELAYQIQMKQNVRLDLAQTMAFVNNCGHIHRALQREKTADRLFQHLLSTIVFVTQESKRDHAEDSCEQVCSTKLEVIFRSVSHLILKDPLVASAA